MKKRISIVLAVLLSIGLLFGLAACGSNGGAPEPTSAAYEANGETAPAGNEVETTMEDGQSTTQAAEEGETAQDETTAAPDESTTEAATAAEGAKSPAEMNRAELVAYYNDAINLVRTQRPGFTRVETLRIDSVETSLGSVANWIIDRGKDLFMPGNPETVVYPKGADNLEHFANWHQVSQLQPSDVASASARRSGENYVITITLGRETNPTANGSNGYSRMFSIITREDILRELDGFATADPNRATMVYHGGRVEYTINPQGQIIAGSIRFQVEMEAVDVRAFFLTAETLTAKQTSSHAYSNFIW